MRDLDPAAAALDRLVESKSIILVAGPGGVGKTTLSAALGWRGAELGRRVAVITVDPARRLGDTLGLVLDDTPRMVHLGTGSASAGFEALMLDPKATFDRLVRDHAPTCARANRILRNRFYRTVSTDLSGVSEYMALERLRELATDGVHDLVIVDTPPDRHAVDVLDAATQLDRLFGNEIFRLLTGQRLGPLRHVNRAGRTLVRQAARIVGAAALDEAIEFFELFEGMHEGFRRRSSQARAVLTGPSAGCALVVAPTESAVRSATHLSSALASEALATDVAIVNRVPHEFTGHDPDQLEQLAAHLSEPDAALVTNLAAMCRASIRRRAIVRDLGIRLAIPTVTVPEIEQGVQDLGGLGQLVDGLFRPRPGSPT